MSAAYKLTFIPAEAPVSSGGAQGGVDLSIQGVEKSFGPKRVLQGVNLQVRAGEFVAIVGKSGCGKSTLLRLVAGLEQADRGELLIDGVPVVSLNQKEKTRVMFQDARLLPWKSVLENVRLGVDGSLREDAVELLAQ